MEFKSVKSPLGPMNLYFYCEPIELQKKSWRDDERKDIFTASIDTPNDTVVVINGIEYTFRFGVKWNDNEYHNETYRNRWNYNNLSVVRHNHGAFNSYECTDAARKKIHALDEWLTKEYPLSDVMNQVKRESFDRHAKAKFNSWEELLKQAAEAKEEYHKYRELASKL